MLILAAWACLASAPALSFPTAHPDLCLRLRDAFSVEMEASRKDCLLRFRSEEAEGRAEIKVAYAFPEKRDVLYVEVLIFNPHGLSRELLDSLVVAAWRVSDLLDVELSDRFIAALRGAPKKDLVLHLSDAGTGQVALKSVVNAAGETRRVIFAGMDKSLNSESLRCRGACSVLQLIAGER